MALDEQGLAEKVETQHVLQHFPIDLLPVDLEESFYGLRYLFQEVQKLEADHPESHDLALAIHDLVLQLQEAVQSGIKESELAWKAEKFEEAIFTLFQSFPEPTQTQILAPLKTEVKRLPETETVTLPAKLIPQIKLARKLTPNVLVKALSLCAALSLPSDRIQFPPGPDVQFRAPALEAQIVADAVKSVILPTITPTTPTRLSLPPQPEVPLDTDRPFQLLEQAEYPLEIVAGQTAGMAQRLDFVLHSPTRRALWDDFRNTPELRDTVALIGLVESNLSADALSHSGAMGPFQDMGGLQGAFGDPDTVTSLARAGLMPQIEDAPTEYNTLIRALQNGAERQRGALLDFLMAEQNRNTAFWQQFLQAQQALLTTPHSAAVIANVYLEDLQAKAANRLGLQDEPLEALNFGVMAYNLGMRHLHTLRRVMAQNYGLEFNTNTVLNFIERDDFQEILRAHHLGELYDNYREAQHYLARFIALQVLVHHNQL